jgi:hypothetical protein
MTIIPRNINGMMPRQTKANFQPMMKATTNPPIVMTMALKILAIFSPEASSI